MSITFHRNNQIVHIKNASISYVMEVLDGKYLLQRYFGKCIREYRGSGVPCYFKRGYNTEHECGIENASFDDIPFEYPVRGCGDYRIAALAVRQESGIEHIEPVFKSWNRMKGKPRIPGLPCTFAADSQVETLEVVCEDEVAQIRIYLYYSIFEDRGILVRHQKIENIGSKPLFIENAKSMSLELPAKEYELLSLYGTHAKEANQNRFLLHHGIQKIESVRGSSSPQHQPFFALLEPGARQEQGEVYAFHLIYSGNFTAETEVDQFGSIRAQIGLNSETFCWKLESGESFSTPEAVLNYSANGLNGMSRNFHWLYKYHLMPPQFADKERPILLNSWESMYYDVTMNKIEEQSDLAREAGIELFVLDDGWFRSGNSSRTSMGDWEWNEKKLPGGIQKAADMIHRKGMQFGLWFEPEAVSKESRLYKEHPDWVLQVPGYTNVEGRHEYILDLSRKDVRDYLMTVFEQYLRDGQIDYIKWDMNRPLTNVNSLLLDETRKGEICHRYILGLYEVLQAVTSTYPKVLFEGCSSGGARFDPGMLYYVAQNWTSDNTDAYDRVGIQAGYSLLYPQVAMGAHVSITPNHQSGRTTSLNTRYQTARLFNLGYELDLTKLSQDDKKEIARETAEYKKERKLIQNGQLYRCDTPNENYSMWSVVSEDKEQCLVLIFQKFYDPLNARGKFRITHLKEENEYTEQNSGEVYGGDELMDIGVTVPLVKEDFHVFSFHFVS